MRTNELKGWWAKNSRRKALCLPVDFRNKPHWTSPRQTSELPSLEMFKNQIDNELVSCCVAQREKDMLGDLPLNVFFSLWYSLSVTTGICIFKKSSWNFNSVLVLEMSTLFQWLLWGSIMLWNDYDHSSSSGLKSKILQGRLTPLQGIYVRDLKKVLWIISPRNTTFLESGFPVDGWVYFWKSITELLKH